MVAAWGRLLLPSRALSHTNRQLHLPRRLKHRWLLRAPKGTSCGPARLARCLSRQPLSCSSTWASTHAQSELLGQCPVRCVESCLLQLSESELTCGQLMVRRPVPATSVAAASATGASCWITCGRTRVTSRSGARCVGKASRRRTT